MLIGIDASRANIKHKSGTEWYAYYLIRWLAKLDDKNQYILYTDKPLRGGLQDLRTYQHYGERSLPTYDKEGCQIIKSPFNNFKAKILKWPFKNFWTLGRLTLESVISRPDLLFMPTHSLPLFAPKRTVATIHDMGFVKQPKLYKREAIGPKGMAGRLAGIFFRILSLGKYRLDSLDYLFWSTSHTLRKADRIIAVSDNLRKDILEGSRIKPEKVSVIYNGYNQRLFCHDQGIEVIDATIAKYGIERPYLFYVGRLDKKKNIPALIEAFAIMKSRDKELKHKLVLAGDAFYGYDEINYMVEEFGLNDDVIMPGWVEELDMAALFRGADAFVFPSFYEGFGIPLLQAMSAGVPIAASDIPVHREIAGAAAVYFDPNLRFQIAQALENILKDRELRDRLVAAGNIRVKDFSWQKTAEETLAVINSLA